MADAPDLGSGGEIRGGSSPPSRTINILEVDMQEKLIQAMANAVNAQVEDVVNDIPVADLDEHHRLRKLHRKATKKVIDRSKRKRIKKLAKASQKRNRK